MNREKKIILLVSILGVAGWITAVVMATSVGAFKLRAMSAESDATNWKRQAGKAYTELLQARAGTGSTTVLIPAGARIDCAMKTTVEGLAVGKCENGIIYPPGDY